jgi:spore germination protein GerM
MSAKKKTTKKKNSASLGIIFWLTFTVVMCALFIINYPKIQQTWNKVFQRTNSAEQGESPIPPVPPVETISGGEELTGTITAGDGLGEGPSGEEELFEAISAAGNEPPPAQSARAAAGAETVPEAPSTTRGGNTTSPTPATTQQPAQPSTRQRTLYFVRVDSTGMVFISSVKRQVAASGSPLNESLGALLAGPSAQEKRNELISLIPEGSRVLGVRVSGGTAFINFNERFLFNSFGAEGYIAQLRQVVWTATDTSNVGDNVQNVQILIDGRTVDYLGDNIPVKTPIDRNSF